MPTNSQHKLPDVSLLGIVNAGGDLDHAILRIGDSEQVVYWLGSVSLTWWLDAIDKDFVLLSDGERIAKVELNYGRPTLLSAHSGARPAPRPRASEIHSLATHEDLDIDQIRTFYAAPEAPISELPEDSAMRQWEVRMEEQNDPGMQRRFSHQPMLESEQNEALENTASMEAALEPGQSRRFGPPPAAEPEEIEN